MTPIPYPSYVEVDTELDFIPYGPPGLCWAEGTFAAPLRDYYYAKVRDNLHTLRVDMNLLFAGDHYVADFADVGKILLAGNLNDDCAIDILDFTVFMWENSKHVR